MWRESLSLYNEVCQPHISHSSVEATSCRFITKLPAHNSHSSVDAACSRMILDSAPQPTIIIPNLNDTPKTSLQCGSDILSLYNHPTRPQ